MQIRRIAGLLDPFGPRRCSTEKSRKLRRRHYSVPGPNYMWHMDSYDKLTQFGIGVNGRDIPSRCEQTSQTLNQVVWGQYRRQNAECWRDSFQEFQSVGDFNGDMVDKGLIQFCFLNVIQEELDGVVRMWNTHRIQPGGNGHDLYHGKPFLMYHAPELYHAQDYLHPVDYRLDFILEEDDCLWKTDIVCDPDLYELCVLIMEEHSLEAVEATRLYRHLAQLLSNHRGS